MYSRAHAAVGGAASLVLVVALFPDASLAGGAAVWSYGVALSVLVDLDHFLVARANVGDWRHLRRALANPVDVVRDQRWIFDEDTLTELQRLLSHALLGGLVVAGAWLVAPALATFTAVVLYVHVVADLLWDNGLV